jgi:sulfur transfer complex TusBCD TusB component (DsrH family)
MGYQLLQMMSTFAVWFKTISPVLAELVRKNGITATLVLHDGFLNLAKWDNMFQTHPECCRVDLLQHGVPIIADDVNLRGVVQDDLARIEGLFLSTFVRLTTQLDGVRPFAVNGRRQTQTARSMFADDVNLRGVVQDDLARIEGSVLMGVEVHVVRVWVNEPLMLTLPVEKVLDWTQEAAELVRKNGITATLVLSSDRLRLRAPSEPVNQLMLPCWPLWFQPF